MWWSKPKKAEQNDHLWFPQNNSRAREVWQNIEILQLSQYSKLKINASDRDSMSSRKVEIPHDVIPASSKHCGSRREVSPGRGRRHQVGREGREGEGGGEGGRGASRQHTLTAHSTCSHFAVFKPTEFSGIQIYSSTLNACLSKREGKKVESFEDSSTRRSSNFVLHSRLFLQNSKLWCNIRIIGLHRKASKIVQHCNVVSFVYFDIILITTQRGRSPQICTAHKTWCQN